MRRTKAAQIYRKTGNLRAVQLLLGHTKLESTVRYLGIEVDDALNIAEQIELWLSTNCGASSAPSLISRSPRVGATSALLIIARLQRSRTRVNLTWYSFCWFRVSLMARA